MSKVILKTICFLCVIILSLACASSSGAVTITDSDFYYPDRNIVPTGKEGLEPGQSATAINFTGVTSGINGVKIVFNESIVDDFSFRTGNSTDMTTWGAPTTPTVAVADNEATIAWSSNPVTNGWLEVTYAPDNLSLYFGNLIGDANLNGSVTPNDALLIINYLNSGASSEEEAYDINNDGAISPVDVLVIINILNQSDGVDTPTLVSGPFSAGSSQPVYWFPVDTTPFSLYEPTEPVSILSYDNIDDYSSFSGLALIGGQDEQYALAVVPKVAEPATILLVGFGLIGLAGLRRKFK
jgi:hypothetical protein